MYTPSRGHRCPSFYPLYKEFSFLFLSLQPRNKRWIANDGHFLAMPPTTSSSLSRPLPITEIRKRCMHVLWVFDAMPRHLFKPMLRHGLERLILSHCNVWRSNIYHQMSSLGLPCFLFGLGGEAATASSLTGTYDGGPIHDLLRSHPQERNFNIYISSPSISVVEKSS
jgi:hypothetical protein